MSEPLTSGQAKRLGAIRRDLLWIADRWADVHESRIKGTKRPWREPTLTPEAREELDRRARAEKAEADDRMPGESIAPVHIDVLDTLADILMRADMLHDHVAATLGVERLDPAPSAFSDPTPYLWFVSEHLGAFCEDDPDGMDAVSDVARDLRAEMARVLGEVFDGQTLAALCPFCGGRDDHHPVGGARTLRVRLIWMPTPDDKDAHEPAIVCTGGRCDPPESDCGTRLRGMPVWPLAEWQWFADRLQRSA